MGRPALYRFKASKKPEMKLRKASAALVLQPPTKSNICRGIPHSEMAIEYKAAPVFALLDDKLKPRNRACEGRFNAPEFAVREPRSARTSYSLTRILLLLYPSYINFPEMPAPIGS